MSESERGERRVERDHWEGRAREQTRGAREEVSFKSVLPLPVKRVLRRAVGERPVLVPTTSTPRASGVLDCCIAYNEYGGYAVPRSSIRRPTAQRIMSGLVWEPEVLALIGSRCGDGDIVHAGAYFGDFLPFLASACHGTVFAFEPNPENFRCAQITIGLNDLKNVRLIESGLGAGTSSASFRTRDREGVALGGGSTIAADGDLEIAMTSIDAVCGDRNVTIVQLDVEGHEGPALQGARETIDRTNPLIIIEAIPGLPADFVSEQLPGYRETARIDKNIVLERTP